MKNLLVICCLWLVVSISANEKYSPASSQYQMIAAIDTVFVTASRVETKIKTLPISTILITKNQIKLKPISDIASILLGEPGIDVRNYSLVNGASTINLLGATSQQVLVLLDGLPINSPSLGTSDLGLIPIHLLDRIEIVKGPSSSLYGANALGGVVNLITTNPFNLAKNPEYDINLNYGSYQTYDLNFQVKSALKNYNFIISNHRRQTDGLRTNDDMLSQGLSFVSGCTFNATNKLRLDFCYETKELGLPGPKPRFSEKLMYGDSTAYSKYDRQSDTCYLIKLQSNWQIKPRWDIIFNARHSINETNFLWVDQWSGDTSLYQDRYYTTTTVGNSISRYRFAKERSVAIGFDYEYDNFSGFSQFPQDTFWNPDISKIGVFSEIAYEFAKIFRALVSLRYDWHSSFGSFISPAIGLTSSLTPHWKLRLHIGKAFRAPTLNDLYWPISGNTGLNPEKGIAGQFGFDYVQEPNFLLTSTFFHRKTKDLISWQPDTTNIWRPVNIDSASITGIEFAGKIKLTDGILLQCSGTIQHAQQIRYEMIYNDWLTGKTEFQYQKRKQAYLPNIILSPGLTMENDAGTKINILARYCGVRVNYYPSYDSLPKIIMQTKKLPAYFILSLVISQRLTKIITLKLNLENLYDTKYAEQFGNSILDKDYPRPGRTIFVGLEIKN